MFKKLTKKSVERKLQEVIDQYKVGDSLGIAKIKDWIFNDHGDSAIDASNRFQKRLFHYFKDVKDINEINEVFQAAVDAWNFYPHKSLGGKSPQQMMEQALKDNPALRKKKDDKMPDIIVGGKKISRPRKRFI